MLVACWRCCKTDIVLDAVVIAAGASSGGDDDDDHCNDDGRDHVYHWRRRWL